MAKTGQEFKQVDDYINEICEAFIEPHEEYSHIECRHKGSDGEAYIKLIDATDNAIYFDITGYTLHNACVLVSRIMVSRVMAFQDVPELITDYMKRKEVASLFR